MRPVEFAILSALAIGVDYDTGLSDAVAYDMFDDAKTTAPAEKPIAVVYVGEGTVSEMQREEYADLNIDWRVTGHPDWVKELPTTHYQQGGRWWAVTGFTLADRLKLLKSGKQAVTTRSSASGYTIRFSTRQWTFPGDIRTHLMGGMHGFTVEELRGYSTSQLIQIHNWEHENGRPRLRFESKGQVQPTALLRTSSTHRSRVFCPT